MFLENIHNLLFVEKPIRIFLLVNFDFYKNVLTPGLVYPFTSSYDGYNVFFFVTGLFAHGPFAQIGPPMVRIGLFRLV